MWVFASSGVHGVRMEAAHRKAKGFVWWLRKFYFVFAKDS